MVIEVREGGAGRAALFSRLRATMLPCLSLLCVLASPTAPALAVPDASAPALTTLQFDIVGVRLEMNPPALTVPKGIPTIVKTALVVPGGDGGGAAAGLAEFAAGAVVQAELRGPHLPPVILTVAPGESFPIPPFALAGDYVLDQIRLVKNGQVLLDGEPPTVPIKVIDQVFVTSVSSRLLTLAEIRDKGIVIDDSNFQALNFQFALDFNGRSFAIDLPVILPSGTNPLFQLQPQQVIDLLDMNRELGRTVVLPPELDRPGLNITLVGVPFFPVEDFDSGDGPSRLTRPALVGLVLIPGNVAFLNQFFSVQAMVANVAPDGSLLSLRDATAEVTLPRGPDHVAGTYGAPGDDPLRLARIEGIGTQPIVHVRAAGPDGTPGSGDDLGTIDPGQSGIGEFLVEGLKEGEHDLDIAIRTTMDGLPSGPIELEGRAIGAVLVRNPKFSITFAHPRTVRAGEPYDLFATVMNTSRIPANLVTVSLSPRSLSGAHLADGAPSSFSFETIPPGESATARFRLIAETTGSARASVVNTDDGLLGNFILTTGVDERGVPLAPNRIVLPRTTAYLPEGLIVAAQRVLGQALSIATAPAGSLPPGIEYVPKRILVERGRDLAVAGRLIEFGDSEPSVVAELMLDWLGSREPDAGFEQLLRVTGAGAAFAEEVGRSLGPTANATGPLNWQREVARAAIAAEDPNVSVVVAGSGAGHPILRLFDQAGSLVGGTPADLQKLPYADAIPLVHAGADSGTFALLSQVHSNEYTVDVEQVEPGAFDLGVVIPGEPGVATQVRFSGIYLGAGGRARFAFSLSGGAPGMLQVDSNGDGVPDLMMPGIAETLHELAPGIVKVRQIPYLDSGDFGRPDYPPDPAVQGLVLGVLFNKPVSDETAKEVSNYTIEDNEALGVAPQPDGRIAYIYLNKPVGHVPGDSCYVDRRITVAHVTDRRGHALVPSERIIEMYQRMGGRVLGQVRLAGGQPVPNAILKLTAAVPPAEFPITLSVIRTDESGGFHFDYVSTTAASFTIEVQNPDSLEIASVTSRVQGQCQTVLLNPTFIGKGTVRGRVLDHNGEPVARAPVFLTPIPDFIASDSQTRLQVASTGIFGLIGVNANAQGEFVLTQIPVGSFSMLSFDGAGYQGRRTGVIPSAGDEVVLDIVLDTPPAQACVVRGRVFRGDGLTPAIGMTMYAGVRLPNNTFVSYRQTITDSSGSFVLDQITPQVGSVVAVDPATQQVAEAGVTLSPGEDKSVVLIFEALGAVQGTVRNAQGALVAGALVAGGTTLGLTNAAGFFSIEGVPAGQRSISAGDPLTRRRGSATVNVLPGQTVNVAIVLESRATIEGCVFAADGTTRMPGITVTIPRPRSGYYFVFANNDGCFRFPDMPLGDYLIEAPGPPPESLYEFMRQWLGIDPCTGYTADPPDRPASLHCGTGPDLSQSPEQILNNAINTYLGLNDPRIVGFPSVAPGGFGWSSANLQQDSQTVIRNVTYLPQGHISGTTVQTELCQIEPPPIPPRHCPTGAEMQIWGIKVGKFMEPEYTLLQPLQSDAQTGAFRFEGGLARYDLATAQLTGIQQLGEFLVEAANGFFDPVDATVRLDSTTENIDGLELVFTPVSENNGSVEGVVYMPDGVTLAPAGTKVRAESAGGLEVQTDAAGHFEIALAPYGGLSLIATDPSESFQGMALARVPRGGTVFVSIRLLGLGSVTVHVQRSDGTAVVHAQVELGGGTFRNDQRSGTSDTNGNVSFTNITEGPFSIVAREAGTGLTGRASDAVVRDSTVAVTVTIRAAGTVRGIFVRSDGITPISDAQVILTGVGDGSGAASTVAFAVTDGSGRFEFAAIPVGRFTLEARNFVTGRAGFADGEIATQGQTVSLTVVERGRGKVVGLVLAGDGVTPVSGAVVELSVSGVGRSQSIQASSGPSGRFEFDVVAVGTFTLRATKVFEAAARSLSGSATGTVESEGQIVVQNVSLESTGKVIVTVRDSDGSVVGNAEVALGEGLIERRTIVDAQGRAEFDVVRVGVPLRLLAHSLATGQTKNGGEAELTLDRLGQVAEVTIQLRGLSRVDVRVFQFDGQTPVVETQVGLAATATVAGAPPSPFADTFIGFTDTEGRVSFPYVPVGEFSATAAWPTGLGTTLYGAVSGATTVPGSTVTAEIHLGESGSTHGRVFLPDGSTPAAEAIVTLRYGTGQFLQRTTEFDGRVRFDGVPIGAFSLSILERHGAGVASRVGEIAFDLQDVDLGDIVLDNTSPRVIAVTPAAGSNAVPTDTAITITFNEPIDRASIHFEPDLPPYNIGLLLGGQRVPGNLSFSADSRMITLTPQTLLASATLYTVVIQGAPLGPKDLVGFFMVDPLVASFTTRDTIPPVIASTTPPDGATNVAPEAPVRVIFSESISPGFSLTLTRNGAIPVPGETALGLGGTTAIFAPTDFLDPNSSYTLRISGVTDLAGNALAGEPRSATFTTVDTIPPVLNALGLVGSPSRIAGTSVVIRPDLVGDAVRVDYRISGVPSQTVTVAPFEASLVLPSGVASVEVTGTAADAGGNRSVQRSLTIGIVPDAPPAVILRNLTGTSNPIPGTLLHFEVTATDDVGVSAVLFSTVGAVNNSQERDVPGAVHSFTTTFDVSIPADAMPGSLITVQAAARDTGDVTGEPASLAVTVQDTAIPTAAITRPVPNAQVLPGELEVVVQATDDAGVARITLECAPALSGCQALDISPSSRSVVRTFRVVVPGSIPAPATITLTAYSTDLVGNESQRRSRTVQVPDTVTPQVVSLGTASGETQVSIGQQVTLRAVASDNIAIHHVVFKVPGLPDANVSVVPPSPSATVDHTFVVPSSAPRGGTLTVQAISVDAATNPSVAVSLPLLVSNQVAPPTVRILAPIAGAQHTEGALLTLSADATAPLGIARVEFFIDGVSVGSVSRAPYSMQRRLPGGPAGPVLIEAVGYDPLGQNTRVGVTIERQNDTAAPAVSLTHPTQDEVIRLGLRDVVIVVDARGTSGASSGVDIDGDGSPESVLEAEIDVARRLVDQVNPALTRIGVASFGATATLERPLTTDRALVEAALDAILVRGPAGSSTYDEALRVGTDALVGSAARRTARAVQLFISGGSSSVPYAEVDRAVRGDVEIDTFGVGPASDNGLLVWVSAQTGGAHTAVGDPSTVSDALASQVVLSLGAVSLEANATDDSAVQHVEFNVDLVDGGLDRTSQDDREPWRSALLLDDMSQPIDLLATARAFDYGDNQTNTGTTPFRVVPEQHDPLLQNASPLRGASGTEVVLQGRYFSPDASGNAVTFNGHSATVTEASKIFLRVMAPAGAGSGPIVLNVDGRSTGGTIFTYDQDADGLSDEEEAAVGTDPSNPDTDGDGLNDYQEVTTYHTNPRNTDTDGDGLSDGFEIGQGTDPNNPDVTPPSVLSVTPPDGTSDFPPNQSVVLTFSEPINGATVNNLNVRILHTGLEVPGGLSVGPDGRTATFAPFGGFIPQADFQVHVEGVKDSAGNALRPVFDSSFHTGIGLAIPSDGLRLWLRGDQDLDLDGSGHVTRWRDASGLSNDLSAAAEENEPGYQSVAFPFVHFDGIDDRLERSDVLGIPPTSGRSLFMVARLGELARRTGLVLQGQPNACCVNYGLEANTSQSLGRRFGAYESGNAVDSTAGTNQQFNILMLSSTSVQPGESVLATSSFFANAAQQDLSLRDGSGFYSAFDTASATWIGARPPFTELEAPLDVAEVLIYSRPLSDEERGQVEGYLSGKYRISLDRPGPDVADIVPDDGATGIPPNANVTIAFSVPVQAGSLGSVGLAAGGSDVAVTRTITADGKLVTLDPLSDLAAQTLHTITVAGVRDFDGVPQATPVTRTFMTGTQADPQSPDLLLLDPFDGATNVPSNTQVVVRFDEPMNRLTVNPSTFFVVRGATAEIVPAMVESFNDADRTFALEPLSGAYPAGEPFDVVLTNAILDLAGNPLVAPAGPIGTFSTRADSSPDTFAPSVSSVSPTSGSGNVDLDGVVTITFDGPIQETSVGANVALLSPSGSVDASRTISPDRRAVVLHPLVPLTLNTPYTVVVEAVRDLAGNPMSAPFQSQFVTGNGVDDITLSPDRLLLVAGESGQLTLSIPDPAPSGGLEFDLDSSDGSVATVPTHAIVPEGVRTTQVQVTAVGTGLTVVTASRAGFDPGHASVEVQPQLAPQIASVTPSLVLPGSTVQGFHVTGAHMIGSTFSLVPVTGADSIVVTNVNLDPAGTSATMTLTVGQSAAGIYVLIATNDAGSSGSLPVPSNTVTAVSLDDDTDGDGLTNRQEQLLGTDFLNADTDGDGFPDGVEAEPALNTNPLDSRSTPRNTIVAGPGSIDVVIPATGGDDGLPMNTIVAYPSEIEVVASGTGTAGDLPLNTIVAYPSEIEVVASGTGTAGDLPLNTIVAYPSEIEVVLIGTGSTGELPANTTIACPSEIEVTILESALGQAPTPNMTPIAPLVEVRINGVVATPSPRNSTSQAESVSGPASNTKSRGMHTPPAGSPEGKSNRREEVVP